MCDGKWRPQRRGGVSPPVNEDENKTERGQISASLVQREVAFSKKMTEGLKNSTKLSV